MIYSTFVLTEAIVIKGSRRALNICAQLNVHVFFMDIVRVSTIENNCLVLFTMVSTIELVSKELNHFGLIAGLFRQFGGHTG